MTTSKTMGEIRMNIRYLGSKRGFIKLMQIVIGFVISSLLCASWHGDLSCFGEGRLGFCSGLNFVVLLINIILYLVNFLNIDSWRLRVYSVICMILFLVASILIIWLIIEIYTDRISLIITAILIIAEFILFSWDTKILQGEEPV